MTIKEYLKAHGLKEEFVKSKEIGWTWNDNEIAIPIHDPDGNDLWFRYRNLHFEEDKEAGNKDTYKFRTNPDDHAYPVIYRIHAAKKYDTIVFAEGEPDTVRLWQEGIPAITGTTGVSTIRPELLTPLRGKKVIICLDTDEEGVKNVAKYWNRLTEAGAKPSIREIPGEYKDVSEFFAAGRSIKDFMAIPEINFRDFLINHEPEDFAWETAEDIRNKDLPEEKWIINKVISKEGFTLFVGPEASSKSLEALLIAKCVTTGDPWLPEKLDKEGKPLFKVMQKTKVLIMDKESTMRRLQDRLRGLGVKTKDIFFLTYPQKFEIVMPLDEQAKREKKGEKVDGYTDFIHSVARKVEKYDIDLIILDSFTDFFMGEENSRKEIQDFVDAFRQLFPGRAVLPLHHAGKAKVGRQPQLREKPRGSSNIMAQVYTAFHFEPDRKDPKIFSIEQTKAGDSLKMPRFNTEVQVIDDPEHRGETLVAGFKYIGEAQEKAEVYDQTRDAMLTFIQNEQVPPTIQEMIEALRQESYKEGTMKKILSDLEKEKIIKRVWSKRVSREKEIVLIEEDDSREDEENPLLF